MHIAEWTAPDGTAPQARDSTAPQVRDSLRVVPGGPCAAGQKGAKRALTRDTGGMAADGTARRSAGRPRDAALDAAILRAAARQLAEHGYAACPCGE